MTSTSTPASSRARVHELVVVLGLPHRAGGHRPDRRAVDVGDLLHPPQRVDAPLDGVGGQPLHVAAAGARGGPSPSRWSTTSKRSSPVTRATTRWKLLVPTSMAASVSTGSGMPARVFVPDPADQRPQLGRPEKIPSRNEPMRARACSADSLASWVKTR